MDIDKLAEELHSAKVDLIAIRTDLGELLTISRDLNDFLTVMRGVVEEMSENPMLKSFGFSLGSSSVPGPKLPGME